MARFADLVESAGYGLTVTPILEHAGVFRRGIGEGSEVVGKEMYVFEDRDGQMMALRPEGTAPIVRAFVQHHPVPPWKAWYVAPSFRHENPQQGRYRQHHQLGVEALGPSDADLDVEVVSLAHDFFSAARAASGHAEAALHGRRGVQAGLRGAARRVPRRAGRRALPGRTAPATWRTRCGSSTARRAECRAATADAPHFLDHLCDACAAHFARVRSGLDALGVRLHHRPPPGPRLRLLHPHDVRVRRGRPRRGAERHRGRRPLRRAGRAARRGTRPRASGSASASSACSSPATPRGCSPPPPRSPPGRCTPT